MTPPRPAGANLPSLEDDDLDVVGANSTPEYENPPTTASEPASVTLAPPPNPTPEVPVQKPVLAEPAPTQQRTEVWKPTEHKRHIPKRAKVIAAAAGGLLLLVIVAGHRRDNRAPSVALQVPDEMVVSESDLKNRRVVEPHEFKAKRDFIVVQGHGASPAPPPSAGDDMAARRARRADDPEDLIAHRQGQPPASVATKTDAPRARQSKGFVDVPDDDAPTPPSASSTDGEAGSSRSTTLIRAGAVVPASLLTPLDLAGGGETVLAQPEGSSLPPGAKLVGTASASPDGRVSLRFTRILLADGRQARTLAEAQDLDGSFGLVGSVQGGTPEEPSAAKEAAKDTAADVALQSLGFGIAGQAARNYARRSNGGVGSYRSGGVHVTLGAGTKFNAFVYDAAVIREDK